MRIIDKDGNTIFNPDLDNGYLTEGMTIKADAMPIDNVTKIVWDDDDYERVLVYNEISPQEKAETRYWELKRKLEDTDYISAKINDVLLSNDTDENINTRICELRKKYSDVMAQREVWRNEIRELETQISDSQGGGAKWTGQPLS